MLTRSSSKIQILPGHRKSLLLRFSGMMTMSSLHESYEDLSNWHQLKASVNQFRVSYHAWTSPACCNSRHVSTSGYACLIAHRTEVNSIVNSVVHVSFFLAIVFPRRPQNRTRPSSIGPGERGHTGAVGQGAIRLERKKTNSNSNPIQIATGLSYRPSGLC